MIKRHISFDHGPPVGSHSAGLAGVLGYLFAILHFSLLLLFFLFFCFLFFFFFYLTISVSCFTFCSRCRTFFPFFLLTEENKERRATRDLGVAKGEIGVC